MFGSGQGRVQAKAPSGPAGSAQTSTARAPTLSASAAFQAGANAGNGRPGLPSISRSGLPGTSGSVLGSVNSSSSTPGLRTGSGAGQMLNNMSSAYSALDTATAPRSNGNVAHSLARAIAPSAAVAASAQLAAASVSGGRGTAPSQTRPVSQGLLRGNVGGSALPGTVTRTGASQASSGSSASVSSSSQRLTVGTDDGAGSAALGTASAGTPSAGSASRGVSPHGLVRRERMRFTLSDFALSTTVGTGTFGRVRIAYHKPTKQWHVLKILKKSEILRQKQLEHIKDEVRILLRVYHPFIVNMLGLHQDDKRLYMLLEYVPGGELFSHLRKEGKFSDSASRFYASEIVLAFEYLHSFNIVYRDLKPENLLLTAKGHVKITDFGFAKVVDDRTYTLCGTPEYLAPEIIQSKGHNKGADWWAIGILIYEMLAGYPPFYDESSYGIYQKILQGKVEWPMNFTEDAKDLIRKLLTADRTKRIGCLRAGASDIKDHPWFKSLNWDVVFSSGLTPPFVPRVREANDTSNFDDYPDSDGDTAGRLSSKDSDLFADMDSF